MPLSRRGKAAVWLILAGVVASLHSDDGGLHLRYDTYRSNAGVQVNSPRASAELDLDRRTRLKAAFLVDAVSAASFNYGASKTHLADPSRKKGSCYQCHSGVDALSGATRNYAESRTQADVALVRRLGEADASIAYTRSQENDYFSETVALGAEVEMFQRNSTLALGLVHMADQIAPVWSRQNARSLYTTGAELTVTQVLTRFSQARLGVSWADAQGYLADPYAFIQVGTLTSSPERANHPLERQRVDLSAAYKQALPWASAAELDYRYYQDSWGVRAHTLECSLGKDIGGWMLEPSYRWYGQSQAYFFRNFYHVAEPLMTRDLKLAAFSTQMLSLSLRGELGGGWSLDLTYSRYLRMDALDYRLYYANAPSDAEMVQVGFTLR